MLNEQKNWIPNQNELVRLKANNKLCVIISVDMGGKCKLKEFTTTKRITKKYSNIDISEINKLKI